ncbi:uncharacterized protein TRAVEDRAFT_50021 [Trametes versicolor FP-101664 SS1]|uniref:uncharacterized protein n=1 Tax=Trametes versicolor (strain FP-101664) TaxID=717944 RepID=UPI00046239AD|nr:uncharacterized protein TRAVEDRAFT_50021 [Trametes versicolor FP-101664 SS1]EIW55535.1 hypothetical protein TRAVEDRAFT_50021 [Trametes versicolor FP-101664 SS1]
MQPDSKDQPVSLLEAPTELLVKIISALDTESLFVCRKVCRRLADVVDGTTEIQYKLMLALMGMVDGPPSDVPIIDRLAALRAYKKVWLRAEYPIHHCTTMLRRPGELRAGGVYPSGHVDLSRGDKSLTESILRVWRPPAPFFGLPERFLEVDLVNPAHSLGPVLIVPGQRYAIDFARNLLIMTSYIQAGDPPFIACNLSNLQDPSGPHPLSSRRVWYGPIPIVTSRGLNISANLQLLGELALAELLYSDGWSCAMMVWNWQTGVLVWSLALGIGNPLQHAHQLKAYLISPSRVVVVDTVACSIRVFQFDPSCTADASYVQLHDCLFTLLTPPIPTSHEQLGRLQPYLTFPPTGYPDCTPHFQQDPSLTMLVLHMRTALDSTPDGPFPQPSEESFVLCIPLSTLLASYPSNGPPHATDEPARSVLWEEWGPRGSRLVSLHPRAHVIATLGSRCAVVFAYRRPGTPPTPPHVYIIELLPFAQSTMAGEQVPPLAYGPTEHVDAYDMFGKRDSSCWGSVQTMYPFRITHREIEGPQTLSVAWRCAPRLALTHEGVAVMVRRFYQHSL